MSPFTPKPWQNLPSTATPISADALKDLEARVAAYADSRVDPVEGSRVVRSHLPEFLVDYYFTLAPFTDKGAAEAAFAAAVAAPRGGIVRFGPRSYALADWAPSLPTGVNKVIDLKGSGQMSTVLNFPTDRGAGTYAIAAAGDGLSGEYCFSLISDMRIVGPSTSTTVGVSPSNMRGIRQTRRMALERLSIVGFHSGVQVAGDHTRSRDVNISNCYYSMYFAQTNVFGDNHIENCDLAGTQFASIAIANNVMASINMIGGHLGFGPYCIYSESGSAGTLSLAGSAFLRVSFEFGANGWIYSPDKSMRMFDVDFINCGFTKGGAYPVAGDIHAANYGFYVGEFDAIRFQGCNLEGAFLLGQINANNIRGFSMDRASGNLSVADTAGIPFMLCNGVTYGIDITGYRFKARGSVVQSGFSIAKGELVGRAINAVYAFAVGGGVTLEGVALNAATTNVVCLVCYEGENIYTLAETTVSATETLVVGSTNRNKVRSEANTGAALLRQQVGRAHTGDGSSGSLTANIRI